MVILVKDIMSKPVVTINQERTAKDAGEIISRAKVGSLIVLKRGKPVGIITTTDLVRKVVKKDLKASKVKIKDIMSKPLITVSPNDNITIAARKIKENKIHRVTVVEGGKVVGILTSGDIAVASQEMLDLLEYRLKLREAQPKIVEKFTTGLCELCGNYSDRLRNVNDQWICEDCEDTLIAEEG